MLGATSYLLTTSTDKLFYSSYICNKIKSFSSLYYFRMTIQLKSKEKAGIFIEVADFLKGLNLKTVNQDSTRPWGGFFVIDETQASEFAKLFFPEVNLDDLRISGKLSPKLLLVETNKRLSWQYHHRRAEIWRVIGGSAGVVTSFTDEEKDKSELHIGDSVRLKQGQRHRLVGLNEWGVLAEIWQHTDAANPSDENDIVRVQDDFGR